MKSSFNIPLHLYLLGTFIRVKVKVFGQVMIPVLSFENVLKFTNRVKGFSSTLGDPTPWSRQAK